MHHRRPDAAARHRASAAKERSLTGSSFVGSFPRADAALPLPLPEIAFLGRSNVGKSSLLNALVGRRIAKVSGTPGKTRMLNVYAVGPCYLLDLPGYGYARASQAERAGFRRLVRHVLERPRLTGVVWLLDLRREPSPEDLAMQDLFARAGTPVLAALTKSDKLRRGERLTRAAALEAVLGVAADQVVTTSARTGEGLADLREAVAALAAARRHASLQEREGPP
jgi:GTP-binding protein